MTINKAAIRWQSFQLLLLQAELLGSYAPVFPETADEVAGIRKPRKTADECKVMVGEQKVFLRFEYSHPLDVFLAAHAVLLAEFSSKSRIAHVAFFRDIRYTDIFIKSAVDIFRYVLYTIELIGIDRASVYIEPLLHPSAHDPEDQPVNCGTEHDIPAVKIPVRLSHAVVEYLTAAEFRGFFFCKVYMHVICPCIPQDI